MFDLNATENSHRWSLTVERNLCTGPTERQFMFGGIGMAASVQAMEQTCRRPVIWATAQYLSFAHPGKIVDLEVSVPVEGRLTSQANVLLKIEGEEIILVHAALGARGERFRDQWVTAPHVAKPQDCDEAHYWRGDGSGLNARLEIRVAQGKFHGDRSIFERGDGRLIFWLRSREGHAVDSRLLAIAADYVPSAIAGATGLHAGGSSLDNTVRFCRIVECEWILCDVQIEALFNGILHGRICLFSSDGVLMATATQSMIMRVHPQSK